MLSVAMRKTKPVIPEIKQNDLPQISNASILPKEKECLSPNKPVGYTFDDMHFGTSPPGKKFMENLKLRMEKM
jgi:hypothetical protein|tara:strand:- start:4300 stop:4518 length:219 start_codon:yes stop_codon:yes gene_type:complete